MRKPPVVGVASDDRPNSLLLPCPLAKKRDCAVSVDPSSVQKTKHVPRIIDDLTIQSDDHIPLSQTGSVRWRTLHRVCHNDCPSLLTPFVPLALGEAPKLDPCANRGS